MIEVLYGDWRWSWEYGKTYVRVYHHEIEQPSIGLTEACKTAAENTINADVARARKERRDRTEEAV